MAVRSVVQFTVGRAGAGKTYSRCAKFLVDELLPETDLVHWSNFPYDRERVALLTVEKRGGVVADYLDRMQQFSEADLARWRSGDSGPWELFRSDENPDGPSLDNVHVAIDEIHEYAGINHSKVHRAKWQRWLGQLRHQGATIEFLTQNEGKVCREIKLEASVRRELTHSDERPDPFFKIELGDWYELRAKMTGLYLAAIWEAKGRLVRDRFERESERMFYLWPEYFAVYDSYSRPESGGVAGGPRKREYERRSWVGLVVWFVRKHFIKLLAKSWILALVVSLFLGGPGWAMGKIIHVVSAVTAKNIGSGSGSSPARVDSPATRPALPQGDASAGWSRVDGAATRPASVVTGQVVPAVVLSPVVAPAAKRRVVLLSPKYCEFDDGEVLGVGRVIRSEPWRGWELVAVNLGEGNADFKTKDGESVTVRLGGDLNSWLREDRTSATQPAVDAVAPVQASNAVSGGGLSPGPIGVGRGLGASGNTFRGRPAVGGITRPVGG